MNKELADRLEQLEALGRMERLEGCYRGHVEDAAILCAALREAVEALRQPPEMCERCETPCMCWTVGPLLMSSRCCIHGEHECNLLAAAMKEAHPTQQEEQ